MDRKGKSSRWQTKGCPREVCHLVEPLYILWTAAAWSEALIALAAARARGAPGGPEHDAQKMTTVGLGRIDAIGINGNVNSVFFVTEPCFLCDCDFNTVNLSAHRAAAALRPISLPACQLIISLRFELGTTWSLVVTLEAMRNTNPSR